MTYVGLISDTHDNKRNVFRAVELFNEEGVELVLHAGDHIAPFTVQWYSRLTCKLVGVLGNLDGEPELLRDRYREMGFEFLGDFGSVEVGGLKIALIHGKNEVLVDALASSAFDVVVRGHTHKPLVERRYDTLVVNPGEACGYLTGRATVAILDTATKEVRIIDLR